MCVGVFVCVRPSELLCAQIHRMVIQGGEFKSDTLKPKEVVSLLLDDAEVETKCECASSRTLSLRSMYFHFVLCTSSDG